MFHGPNNTSIKEQDTFTTHILAFTNVSKNGIIIELPLQSICPFEISSVSF